MKKNERLMQQLGEVEDKYIAEAFPTANASKSHIKRIIIGAMGAAAAGVIVWQGAANIPNRTPEKEAPSTSASQGQITNTTDTSSMATTSDTPTSGSQIIEFPKSNGELEIIDTSGMDNGGMGFEGYRVYNISELIGANPSRENCEFTELPVFFDCGHERYKLPRKFTTEEMEKRLKDIAGELTDEEFTPIDVRPDSGYYEAKAGDITIKMEDKFLIINFGKAIDLPDEYGVFYRRDDREQAVKSINYLLEKYKNIIQLDNPVPVISTNYDIDNNAGTSYYFYNDSEDPLTALMNYNFRQGSFTGETVRMDDPYKYANPYDAYKDTGDLITILIEDSFSYKYENLAGMYPVISYDEAHQKLIGGDYTTTVWVENDLPNGMNTDEIFFTGISYKRTENHRYYLPYYRFLIELHPERSGDYALSEGMKEYGAFYVPAVTPDYLASENTDVGFN